MKRMHQHRFLRPTIRPGAIRMISDQLSGSRTTPNSLAITSARYMTLIETITLKLRSDLAEASRDGLAPLSNPKPNTMVSGLAGQTGVYTVDCKRDG
jgi:hypothetical protein